MGKLSAAIVQHRLASLRDVEEALAKQVLYGGDLATNLLEQAPRTDERELVELLAETYQLPAAPSGEIPPSSFDTRGLVPGDVALRHGLYPLEHTRDTLVVAVSEPIRPEVEQDLGFGLGLAIAQRVAPMVRVRQAISRDYGLPLDRRTQRVLAKLEGKPDPSPSLFPEPLASATDISSLPRPPSMPPIGLPMPMDLTPLYGGRMPSVPPLAPTPLSGDARAPSVPPPAIETRAPSVPPPVETRARSVPPPPVQKSVAPASTAAVAVRMSVRIEAPKPTPPAPEASIHERLTAKAPEVAPRTPMAAPVELPVPPTVARAPALAAAPAASSAPATPRQGSVSGQHSIPLANLAALGTQAAQPRTRHRGPYTAAEAEQDLFAAEGRDGVLSAFFDFTSQYFEYSALFAVHGDLAEGRFSRGPGADHARVTGIGVPLDLPGALATARREGRFVITALAADGLDGRLAADLERRPGRKVLFLPVLVRGRCVVVLYGDHGSEDVELSQIGEVLAFAPLVASALESVIVRKKTAVRVAVGEPLGSLRPSLRRRPPMPSREERAEALASALVTTVRVAEKAVAERAPTERAPATRDTRKRTEPGLASRSEPKQAPAPAVLPSPDPGRTSTEPGMSLPTPPRRAALEPIAASPPEQKRTSTEPAVPSARSREAGRPPPLPRTDERPSDPPGTPVFPLSRRTTPLVVGGGVVDAGWDIQVPSKPKAVLADDQPEIDIGTAVVDWSEDDEPSESRGIPDRQVVVPAQAPVKAHSSAELRLPKVIVNTDIGVERLVQRLLSGDETVVDALLDLGTSAASVLVSHFPGPVNLAPDRIGSSDLASQRGPVLRTLARIGQRAAPFVAVRCNDPDPVVRAWATRLLGEMPSMDSAHAVARRVTDSSPEVRRAALDAGKLLQSDEESRTALRDRILLLAEDSASTLEVRGAALEALAHLRDGRAVPRLIRLGAANDELAQSAQWALGVLTRQAFGRDTAAWEAWWNEKSAHHRIEWLIDSLMHDDPDVRRNAGEELKAVTKEYFGYYDDLSKSERAKAQRRYREWWESTGKARFSG